MKESWRRKLKVSVWSVLVCVMAVFLMPGIRSEAASKKPTCAKCQTRYVRTDTSWYDGHTVAVFDRYQKGLPKRTFEEGMGIAIKNLSSKAKITSVKSSNPKVLTAKYSSKDYKNGIIVTFKNFGTSKVTFKVKQNGKTYTLSCKYTFKKTPTPLKSLKVGGKQIASKLTGKTYYSYDTNKKSVKISYAPKSTVKIGKITYIINEKTGKEIKIKNNSTVKIPAKGLRLLIYYRYKYGKYSDSTGNYDIISLRLTR